MIELNPCFKFVGCVAMLPSLPATATGLLLIAAFASLIEGSSRRFDRHPHVQCSACKAVMFEIGEKMNESAKIRSSYKIGHRLDVHNRKKFQDYESSELRAIEITESVCSKSLGGYNLKHDVDGARIISKNNSLKAARFYGRSDRDELEEVGSRLKDFCNGVMDEHDEAVVAAIKTERQFDGLVSRICDKELRVCATSKVDKARKDEIAKYDKAEAKRKQAEKEAESAKAAEASKPADVATNSTEGAGAPTDSTRTSPTSVSSDSPDDANKDL